MKQIFSLFLILACHQISFSQNFNSNESAIILSGDTSQALSILPYHTESGKKALRSNSSNIAYNDTLLPILLHRMLLTVQHPDHDGVGIAAPQVGINRNVIWVQRFDKPGHPFEYFINPVIIWKSALLQKGPEGDLSFDDRRDGIYRSYVITVQYQDLQGHQITTSLEGFTAVIFQHEVDHLYGTLLMDRHQEQQNKIYNKAQQDLYTPSIK